MDEESLFAAALEKQSESERRDFLEEVCAGDLGLRRRLDRLLKAHGRPPGILDRSVTPPRASEDSRTQALGSAAGGNVGRRIADRYQLLETIGEGGMGTVWLAEQTAPVRRRVAVKLVRAEIGSRSVLARLEAERQALALMEHPNIAKVLDGGTTEDGLPFFVMEYVAGLPITQHCDNAGLGIRDRLELFVPVCQAVQHAHTKGLIHRDLKPANVLVASCDGGPVPKVIDFGIAKATGPGMAGPPALTQVGQLVGTPLYMSPEQAGLGGLDVDTRSDIYSLGVLLYELLTGSTPFEAKGPGEAASYDILRAIREEEPETPSRRLATTQELTRLASTGSGAAHRRTEPGRQVGLVRGDLDWIVMKALEKDRNRRYETAEALAMDLKRYLADEVVLARPPGTGYRLRKFVRRNRGRVAATMALAVSLIAGSGGVIVVQARAQRERAAAAASLAARDARASASMAEAVREARERADEAWNAADDPDRMRQATAAVETAVRRAEIFAAGGSTDAPRLTELTATRRAADVLARYTDLIAAGEENRQQFAADLTGQEPIQARAGYCERQSEALRQLELNPLEGLVDEVASEVVDSRLRDALLGMILEWQGHAAAVADARQKDPGRVPETPAADRAVADRLGQVVRSVRQHCGGRYARWQDLLDRGDIPGLVAFAESPDALEFRSGLVAALGRDLQGVGQYSAMRALLRTAIERYPRDAWLHFDLAYSARSLQPPDYAEALRHMSAATVLRPDSALFQLYLGEYYAKLGSYDRAISAHRQAIRLRPDSANMHRWLGRFLLNRKDWNGAIAAFREAIRLKPDDSAGYVGLGTGLMGAGRTAEGMQTALDGLKRNPAQLEDPRSYVRYNTACLALNCADGKGGDAPTSDERAAYRNQALDLLIAELAAIRRLAKPDPAWVHRTMQHWLKDEDLASIREAGTLEHLPDDVREAWRTLWTEVRGLRDATASNSDPPRTID